MSNQVNSQATSAKAALIRKIKTGSAFHVRSAEGVAARRSSQQAAASAMRSKSGRLESPAPPQNGSR